MRRLMLTAALIAAPAAAQDSQEERDRGFLVGLIEDNVKAPGLSVRLDGFQGALSSEATLERLSVSDDEGTWLTLEQVTLAWNRSALLRGRLEVDELSAELIRVDRAPLPAEGVDALPDAGASGFALPDLPVSIDIGQLRADRIELGADLLGQDLALSLEAAAALADGSGEAELVAARLDGTEGAFTIAAAFDAEREDLSLNLAVSEAEGGLAATLLSLPGAPAIDLTIQGAGPLDAFSSDIVVASDGAPRITGAVTLAGTEEGRRFDVDLGGDMTALLAPDYRPFFGDNVGLEASGLILEAGGTNLETLQLDTQALSLTGEVRIGADGWPSFVDVDGVIAAADGQPVVLPTADAATLRRADLAISYDAANADDFSLRATIGDYSGDGADLEEVQIGAQGTLRRRGTVVDALRARFDMGLFGLMLTDRALDRAIGNAATLTGEVTWAQGQPTRIADLALSGAGYGLVGDIVINQRDEGLTIAPDLRAQFSDLARLSGLAGQELAGAADLELVGDVQPVAGSFDLAVAGRTRDLQMGIAEADALLDGETDLTLRARRTQDGTALDNLDIRNGHVTLTANAALVEADALTRGLSGRAVFDARILDGTRLDPRLNGPVTLSADLTQDRTGVWVGGVRGTAPEGVTISAEGQLTGEAADVAFRAGIPDLAAFVPGLPDGLTLAGRAFAIDGIWAIDAEANGPWDLTAAVRGPVTGDAPEIAFQARLPDLSGPVPGVAEIEALAGSIALDGTIAQRIGVWVLDTGVETESGITARAEGPVTGPAAALDILAEIPTLEALVPAELPEALRGAVELQGAVDLVDAIDVDLSLRAPADITMRARGAVTGDTPSLDVAATIPGLERFVSAIEGTLSLNASLDQRDGDWAADVTATGPADTRATIQTILTASPLRAGFTLVAPDLGALVAGLPGALDVTGAAQQIDAGWQIDLAGIGPYTTSFDAVARLIDGVPSLNLTGRLPESRAVVPQLSGPVAFRVAANQTGADWTIDANASGAQGLSVSLRGLATGPTADLTFEADVANVAPFVPGLSGALSTNGRLFQSAGNWAVDLAATGPLGSRLDADGVLTGARPEARFDLSVGNIGPLVPDIPGPARLTGTAAQQGSAWLLDVDAQGPSGIQAAIAGAVETGGALNLSVNGSAPLGLANAALAPQRLAGVAQFDLVVNGPPAIESVSGTITTAGAALSLPTLRNGLEDLSATIGLSNGRAQIELATAVQSGGRITVAGPVALSPPFDGSLSIDADVQLEDPALYTTRILGDIAVNGPLAGGALISGGLTVDGAEISVPSTGITALGAIPPIEHVGTPAPVARTLARAGQQSRSNSDPSADGGGAVYGLNLFIDAPGRIFVRGRGLDAELGGRLDLRGTTANPIASGGFTLARGRLDLLGQRFDLDEGSITFQGDFIPNLRLVAKTETETLDASIIIEGPADEIEVRFESTPDVPEEEILAQIFFGRDLSQLTPFQAVQLANSVAVLAGRGNGGLLESLRGGAGLADLDVQTNDDGSVGVRAGLYLSENIYTDVQVDDDGGAEVSLNLDIREGLTLRGSTNEQSQTSFGIFFERDY